MNQELNKKPITDFIPQRMPFVMVDTLNEQSNQHAVSVFKIVPDNIFVNKGSFSESGLLENIAQTAAANVGYECAKQNIPVPLGFIGAISKVKLFRNPEVNTEITTHIKVLQEIFGITLIEGTVYQNEDELIKCQMKIMIQNQSDEIH